MTSHPLHWKTGMAAVASPATFSCSRLPGPLDRGLSLDACEAVTRKANARTFTMGVALEPCSMPQTRRHNFEIGPDDIEIGMGIHGEPGVIREKMMSADAITDRVMDRIFSEMKPAAGDRVAVLINSFGATPLMELYILFRR